MLTIFLLSYLISAVAPMSSTVPDSACESMFPVGHSVAAQTTVPPFVLMVPEGEVPAGSQVNGKIFFIFS